MQMKTPKALARVAWVVAPALHQYVVVESWVTVLLTNDLEICLTSRSMYLVLSTQAMIVR